MAACVITRGRLIGRLRGRILLVSCVGLFFLDSGVGLFVVGWRLLACGLWIPHD